MNCKRCGASWNIGNLTSQIEICPVCGVDFKNSPENRKFETILEVLQYLIQQYGIEYWNNDKSINGFLNDYFPEKVDIRNDIRFLLENDIGKKMIEWYQNFPNRIEVSNVFDTISFQGNKEVFIDAIMFLTGCVKENGTDLNSATYYELFAKNCSSIEYKIMALEKALKFGVSSEIEIELADLKLNFDKESGLNMYQELAEKDNIHALLRLAKMYEQGLEVNKDYNKAIEYLNKASVMDDAEGMFQLGRFHMLGYGVVKDIVKAVELFEKASEHKHAKANYQLYSSYYEKNTTKELAIEKLIMSAESKYLPAMYEYALHLLYGEQVAEDVTKAIALLEECALLGKEEAIEKLRFIYSTGYKVIKDKEKALEWKARLMEE